MGGGGVGESLVGHVIEDGVAAFEQFDVQAGEESVEAAVLLAEMLCSELVFTGGPFLQGFDGDVESGFDALEVAVELVEEVEGFDFVIESVAFWHRVESFGLMVWRGIVAQVFGERVGICSRFEAPRPPAPSPTRAARRHSSSRGGDAVCGVGMCVEDEKGYIWDR